jgi:hypothetical protein
MEILCGPWSESPDSELIYSLYEIAVSLLEEVGLDLTPILGAEPPSSPDAPAWHCLLKLPIFSESVSSSAFRGTLFAFMGESEEKLPEHKNRRILSSDQLFLGIMKSPRPDHLITALTKIGDVIAASSEDLVYPHIERALDSLFHRRLSVPELAGRVRALAGRLQLPLPTGRKWTDYLSWLDEHSEAAMALLTEIVTAVGVV